VSPATTLAALSARLRARVYWLRRSGGLEVSSHLWYGYMRDERVPWTRSGEGGFRSKPRQLFGCGGNCVGAGVVVGARIQGVRAHLAGDRQARQGEAIVWSIIALET
jgi:hypothetical protein